MKTFDKPIFLIGYMGAGKTTLGQAVSKRLNIPFIDLDEFIENQQGKTVSQIFADDGEAMFRRLEKDAIEKIVGDNAASAVIVALGGGTPCQPGVMDLLNSCGITVYLTAPVPRLTERLVVGGDKRPLVAGKTPGQIAEFVHENLSRREPFYSLAKYKFDASLLEDELQIEQSAQKFIKLIQPSCN